MKLSLKKSFELQHKLANLIELTERLLYKDEFMFERTIHHYKSRVNSEAVDEDEVLSESENFNFTQTQLIDFYVYLINTKIGVSDAIEDAKVKSDYTKIVNGNIIRREMLKTLQTIYSLKSHTLKTTRTAYKFNADGEQVEYEYDAEVVNKINFDRNAVRAIKNRVANETNEASERIDKCLATIEVEIEPLLFDVDDTLEDAVQSFAENK
jgi:hypothetical protein